MKKKIYALLFGILLCGCKNSEVPFVSNGRVEIDSGDAYLSLNGHLENAFTKDDTLFKDEYSYERLKVAGEEVENAYINDLASSGTMMNNWNLTNLYFDEKFSPISLVFSIENCSKGRIIVSLNDETITWDSRRKITISKEIEVKAGETGNLKVDIVANKGSSRSINEGKSFGFSLTASRMKEDIILEDITQPLVGFKTSYDELSREPYGNVTLSLKGKSEINMMGECNKQSIYYKNYTNVANISAMPLADGTIDQTYSNYKKLRFEKDHYYLFRLDFEKVDFELQDRGIIRFYPSSGGVNLQNTNKYFDDNTMLFVNKFTLDCDEEIGFAFAFYSQNETDVGEIIYKSILVVDLGLELPPYTNEEFAKKYNYFSNMRVSCAKILLQKDDGMKSHLGTFMYNPKDDNYRISYKHNKGDTLIIETQEGYLDPNYSSSTLNYKSEKL